MRTISLEGIGFDDLDLGEVGTDSFRRANGEAANGEGAKETASNVGETRAEMAGVFSGGDEEFSDICGGALVGARGRSFDKLISIFDEAEERELARLLASSEKAEEGGYADMEMPDCSALYDELYGDENAA